MLEEGDRECVSDEELENGTGGVEGFSFGSGNGECKVKWRDYVHVIHKDVRGANLVFEQQINISKFLELKDKRGVSVLESVPDPYLEELI